MGQPSPGLAGPAMCLLMRARSSARSPAWVQPAPAPRPALTGPALQSWPLSGQQAMRVGDFIPHRVGRGVGCRIRKIIHSNLHRSALEPRSACRCQRTPAPPCPLVLLLSGMAVRGPEPGAGAPPCEAALRWREQPHDQAPAALLDTGVQGPGPPDPATLGDTVALGGLL